MERTTSTLDQEQQFLWTRNEAFDRGDIEAVPAQAQPDVQWANGDECDGQIERLGVWQCALQGVR